MKPTDNLDKSGGIPMKKYLSGFITGALATTCMFIFLSINLFFIIFEIECVDNIGFFDLNDRILNFFILAIK